MRKRVAANAQNEPAHFIDSTDKAVQLKALQNALSSCSAQLKEHVTKRGILGRKKKAVASRDLRKLVSTAGLGASVQSGLDKPPCLQLWSSGQTFNLVSWNVRGLGDDDKCKLVRDGLSSPSPAIICVQETKLNDVSRFKAASFLPHGFSDFSFVEATGTRGGLLTAWNPNVFSRSSFIARQHTLTTSLTSTSSDLHLTVTNVYAPADHRDSQTFLDDLVELASHVSGPWLHAGDFNLLRDTADKNNERFDFALAAAFNDAINQLNLIELPLLDRLFTWSNKRASPTLARLDRVFINRPSHIPTQYHPHLLSSHDL
ncbi:hypothetical protein EJB05_52261, partial [Eragrostis curvula]